MAPLWQNPALLESLYFLALAKAFLRYRNPLRRQSGKYVTAFYDQQKKRRLIGVTRHKQRGLGKLLRRDSARVRLRGADERHVQRARCGQVLRVTREAAQEFRIFGPEDPVPQDRTRHARDSVGGHEGLQPTRAGR